MVWFSEDVLSVEMIYENFLTRLRYMPVEEGEEESRSRVRGPASEEEEVSPAIAVNIDLYHSVLCTLGICNMHVI
jgi:dynein heavy chain 1